MFSNRIKRSGIGALLLAAAVAVPGAGTAYAQSTQVDGSASARLEAKANADVSQAQRIVSKSREKASRLISRSQRRLEGAYRMTSGVNAQAQTGDQISVAADGSARYVGSIDRNSRSLVRIVRRSKGRVQQLAASSLSRNVEMRTQVVGSLSASTEGVYSGGGQVSGETAAKVSGLATGQVETFKSYLSATGSRIKGKARRLVNRAVAKALEAQMTFSQSVVGLHAQSDASAKASLSDVAQRVADETERIRQELEKARSGRVSISSQGYAGGDYRTLGELSMHAAHTTRVNADALSSVEAEAHAEAHAYLGLF